ALFAEADVVPLVVEVPVGDLTPIDAMAHMGTDPGCFLLESVEGSGKVARWSLLGHAPDALIEPDSTSEDPLRLLENRVGRLRVARPAGLEAPFTGGAVGYLSYDAARMYERLPEARRDSLALPPSWFARFPTVAV